MFCMGIVLHYARNKTPEAMIKRGIKLFILSIIVNIGEFIIPHFLFGTLFNSWNMINIHNGLSLFTVDILGFAALFFIVMGIFKKINLSNKQILAIGIVLSLVGSYFRFIDFGSASLNLLFGYFIGTSKAFTAFPLFNWIMFPIAGYVYGTYFINTKDKSRFFRFWPIFIIVSLTYLMIFLYLTSTSNNENIESLYYMTTLELIFNLLYIHGNLGFCYWLSKRLPMSIKSILSFLSINITKIYMIQWYLIPIVIILIMFANILIFDDLSLFIISIIMLIISSLFALGYNKLKSGIKSNHHES